MKYLLLFLGIFGSALAAQSQTSQTDSIFESFHLKYSPEALKQAKLEYEMANDTIRNIMERVYALPMSSRAELVENYEKRSQNIENLMNEFNKSVPKDYVVFLEIRMDDGPLKTIQDIDMQIFKKNREGKLDLIDADWDIKYGSPELDSLLQIIDWDPMTFSNIKNLMQMANCFSIQNGDQTEIGFARSGVGKYSYLIFPNKLLTVAQIKRYNDGCEHIYYKKNIVLKYSGGMVGPQCFTD